MVTESEGAPAYSPRHSADHYLEGQHVDSPASNLWNYCVPCLSLGVLYRDYIGVVYGLCRDYAGFRVYWPLVSWKWRNGKDHGNCYNGLYRDHCEDPVLQS